MATPQLLQVEGMDYLVYDFLAEITMSILARARANNPDAGFATDFITGVLKPNLREIAEKEGQNPDQCGRRQSGGMRRGGARFDCRGRAGFESRGD